MIQRLLFGMGVIISSAASAASPASECAIGTTSTPPRLLLTLDRTQDTSDLAIHIGAPALDWPSNPSIVERDLVFSGGAGDAALRFHADDGSSVRIERATVKNAQNAVSLQRTTDAYIFDLTFRKVIPKTIYASVLRIGMDEEKRTRGPTVVQRVFADGEDTPLSSYKVSNTDFLTSGPKNPPVFIRDVTARNFSDAIIDNKSVVYISNATLSDAHRILRAHPGAKFVIANSIINSAKGRSLAWLGNIDSSIQYYNTLWNGRPVPDPALVQSRQENLSTRAAADLIKPLAFNPLPDLHPVFSNSPSDLSITSRTDDKIWTPLKISGLTYGPAGLVGDIRIVLPKPDIDTEYCLIGTFGDSEPAAVSLWKYDVSLNRLSPVTRE